MIVQAALQQHIKSSQVVNHSTTNSQKDKEETNELLNPQDEYKRINSESWLNANGQNKGRNDNSFTSPVHNYSSMPVHSSQLQTKLSVNTPGDEFEQEADAVADKVMNLPGNDHTQTKLAPINTIQHQYGPGVKEEKKEDQKEEKEVGKENIIQRKESRETTPPVSAAINQALQSPGESLDEATRSFMERRFGYDFSKIKIHDNSTAHHSAHSINALAYTFQQNIVFASGQYQPSTYAGKKLLAHELTHTIQQTASIPLLNGTGALISLNQTAGNSIAKVQRKIALGSEDLEVLSSPVKGTLTVNIFMGFLFTPDDPAATYKPNSTKYIQAMAGIFKALTGEQYLPALVTEYVNNAEGFDTHYGGTDQPAKDNEPFKNYFYGEDGPKSIVSFLEKKSIVPKLTPEQHAIIQAYHDTDLLYKSLKENVPKWFNRQLLAFIMIENKTELTKFATLKRKEDETGNIGKEKSSDSYAKLEKSILFFTNIIEAVRTDALLAQEPAYRVMWNLPYSPPDAKIKIAMLPADEDSKIDMLTAFSFIQQCRTNTNNASKATRSGEAGHKARAELLKYMQPLVKGADKPADTSLSDTLNRYNKPPFPATLQCYPPLAPPLFELVANTAPVFSMSVEWGSFYDALGFAFSGRYGFELIRVSDDKIKALMKAKEGEIDDKTAAGAKEELDQVNKIGGDQTVKGSRPGIGDVISQKYHKRVDYLAEDIGTVVDGLGKEFGVTDGVGILSLDLVGSALGTVGDVIGSFWEDINSNRWEKKIAIKDPGLYIVRSTAYLTDISGDAKEVHAPSIAWLPVWLRSAEDTAVKFGEQLQSREETALLQLQSVDKELLQTDLPAEKKASLQKQKEGLTIFLYGTAAQRLKYQLTQLEESLAISTSEQDKEAIESQIKETKRLIEIQDERLKENISSDTILESPFAMSAVFVSDDGSSRRFIFELIEKPQQKIEKPQAKTNFQYFVSDLSSSKSSSETGPFESTREAAIKAAIEKYLSQPNRYGRGYCTIIIPPVKGSKGVATKETFRVTSNADAIVLDSVENIASALSMILIAAAPLTGGATLAFVFPVGLVGAIPSAYRIYDRVKGDSFSLDYGTAMDMINVISSFAGLGGKAASGMKWLNVGKGFVIVGIGLDGLGFVVGTAQTLEEIDEISKRDDLSPGTRRAMIMSAFGRQLAAAGMMIGDRIAESGQAIRANDKEFAIRNAKPIAPEVKAPVVRPHVEAPGSKPVIPHVSEAPGATPPRIPLPSPVATDPTPGTGVRPPHESGAPGATPPHIPKPSPAATETKPGTVVRPPQESQAPGATPPRISPSPDATPGTSGRSPQESQAPGATPPRIPPPSPVATGPKPGTVRTPQESQAPGATAPTGGPPGMTPPHVSHGGEEISAPKDQAPGTKPYGGEAPGETKPAGHDADSKMPVDETDTSPAGKKPAADEKPYGGEAPGETKPAGHNGDSKKPVDETDTSPAGKKPAADDKPYGGEAPGETKPAGHDAEAKKPVDDTDTSPAGKKPTADDELETKKPGIAADGPTPDQKPIPGAKPQVEPVDMKALGVDSDPPQILEFDDFTKVKLEPGQDALYILRDDNGNVLKVGKTSEKGAVNRFRRYKVAGNLSGMKLQLEVHPLKPSGKKAQYFEKALRAKMESEGHAMPWDNTGKRLGRPGFGTPGEGLRRPPITKGEMKELLTAHNGNLREVGKELGVHRGTVRMWAKALGLNPLDFKIKK